MLRAQGQSVSYSEYNDNWAPGWAPNFEQPTAPPPPPKETMTQGASMAGSSRLCACNEEAVVCSTAPPGGARAASASRLALSVASAAVAMSFGGDAGVASRLGVAAMAIAWSLPSADAHNWQTSPTRGNEAGENNGFNGFQSPPGPQKTSRHHVEVGLGQKFPVEWAAGHGFGSYTYFAITKAGDEARLDEHSIELLASRLHKPLLHCSVKRPCRRM